MFHITEADQNRRKTWKALLAGGYLLATLCIFTTACGLAQPMPHVEKENSTGLETTLSFENTDAAYTIINDNIPDFREEDYTTEAFERYSELDALGRCGVAYANIGQELMPTEERGSIGRIKPSGWQLVKYDCVEGKYLYNRCHLIGYQLAGENDNERNLITGTRYLNVDGMLPFENRVAGYVKETGNHVLYRVTPVYIGDNLVADGVQMEAWSVEDNGQGICFNVYVYNRQPGVTIDYATGESRLAQTTVDNQGEGTAREAEDNGLEQDYVLNNNTKKFHNPSCTSVGDIKPKNRQDVQMSREELLYRGYKPCGLCKP